MTERDDKINQIVAIAIQAQSHEYRLARQRNRARRAEQETAERYRRKATECEQAFSTGFPTVCTIH